MAFQNVLSKLSGENPDCLKYLRKQQKYYENLHKHTYVYVCVVTNVGNFFKWQTSWKNKLVGAMPNGTLFIEQFNSLIICFYENCKRPNRKQIKNHEMPFQLGSFRIECKLILN